MLATELAAIAARHRTVKVLSAYISVPAGAADSTAHARIALRNGVAAAHEALATASHVERTAFDACVARIQNAFANLREPLGGRTWVAFASAGSADGATFSVSVPALLPLQGGALVAWDTGIRLAPFFALDVFAAATVALVDQERAALLRLDGDELRDLARFETHAKVEVGSHMSSPPRASFHPGTRGTPATDVAARQMDHAEAQHRARIAGSLTALNGTGRIFVGGGHDTAVRVIAELPLGTRARAVLVPELHINATAPEICAAVRVADREQRAAESRSAVDTALAAARSGRTGVLGLGPVRAGLAQSAVAGVVVSTLFLEQDPVRLEEIVRDALAQSAEVRIVHGDAASRLDAEAAGIAATLRFPLYQSLSAS
jgi:hypothetical protein